ncbi:MAG: lasso peptide biosynthesis PqqD family chaperone [Bacillota bacterium]|jgi:hypothetical protein|nr:lasso peptide biosynthesis PqqD family chaperone [Clostridia bacterium]
MKGEKILRETVISRQAGIITADLDGEIAMMSLEKGKYYGLNSVASRIWEFLDQPVTVQELTKRLMKEYQVDEDTCFRETSLFLNKLFQEGLISLDFKTF